MYAEDLPDPGTYIDSATGDIWEKRIGGIWYVNGMRHKPFPHSLTKEQPQPNMPQQLPVPLPDDYRPVNGYPRYEVNRFGTVRYRENKTFMAPSMEDRQDSYYPLMTEDHIVHLVSLTNILNRTFPE